MTNHISFLLHIHPPNRKQKSKKFLFPYAKWLRLYEQFESPRCPFYLFVQNDFFYMNSLNDKGILESEFYFLVLHQKNQIFRLLYVHGGVKSQSLQFLKYNLISKFVKIVISKRPLSHGSSKIYHCFNSLLLLMRLSNVKIYYKRLSILVCLRSREEFSFAITHS